ncbi:MAG: alkaline phosphatase family protein [Amphritea sp.]
MNKLILIMIDGISAELFTQRRSWMPHLHALAEQGTRIQALAPEVCGTSFPGRTSMIVGRPAAEHGIYGNKIWDGMEFRWSNPYDVRTPTLAGFAKMAGRDVANIGYGMVRPEDCNVYCTSWWVDDVMNRARNEDPHPTDEQWTMLGRNLDPDKRIAALAAADINISIVNPDSDKTAKLSLGMLADQQLLEIAAGLANSEQAPDLIMLEIGITDYYLHTYGSDHPLTEWSLRTADSQVGLLMERLRKSGTLDDYNFAIMSDHGHGPIPDAVYCDQLLPEGVRWSSEGGMLLVAPRSDDEAQQVIATLAEMGIELWNNDFLPEELRHQLLAFTHPEDTIFSFEKDSKGSGNTTGQSNYNSNHGMRPGTEADYRFCIFSGPRVPQGSVSFGTADQVAPTLAALMNVTTDWTCQPLFQPV